MPRLIDDLRAEHARLAKPSFVPDHLVNAWGEIVKRVYQTIAWPELPVLLIDNVSDYLYSSEQEYWDLRKDFPNLAPPYSVFWAECKMARQIHSAEKGDTNVAALVPHGRLGMLIHGLNPSECKGEGIPAEAKWILWCELFIDYGRRDVTADGPHGSVFLCLDENGAILGSPWMQSLADQADAEIMRGYITFFNPVFLAMSFLHCKNVVVVENDVPPKLAKKYRARTGVQPCRYKTLVIEPLKQILRTQGGAGNGNGLAKAMHICRGHFRDYRQGAGLFGKYHALVWTPMIVRGTKGTAPPAREIEVKL